MAQIELGNIQKIVEKNMRNLGFEGDHERGWQDTIIIPNHAPIEQKFNLQTMRDIISQSIVDALTDTEAQGTVSEGNVPGGQTVVKDPDTINITKDSSLLSSNAAARVGDKTLIDFNGDAAAFWAWATLMNTYMLASGLTAPEIAALAAAWTALTNAGIDGKISTGSSSVKIGD